ncbi:MAG: methyltransferase domain-containing protein [Myxococcota bacterium]
MDWIKTFYAQQTRWVPRVYLGDVTEHHRIRVQVVEQTYDDHSAPLRVLELGCGGGQMAAAIADLGHQVTAIDLNEEALQHACSLASSRPNMAVVGGDFYQIELQTQAFDVVCYFDGFGIGTDADQRRLLQRITTWLSPHGVSLIDIYTPWYWSRVAGQQMTFDDIKRCYDFDPQACTMLDRWWHTDAPHEAITQVLRCYTPADLKLLLEGTGLRLTQITPGGGMDSNTGRYVPTAPLKEAMQYLAHLKPCAEVHPATGDVVDVA